MSTIDFNALSVNAAMVLDPKYAKETYTPIDLSVSNDALREVNASSSDDWEKYIEHYLASRGKSVAFGGYLERRNLYQRSTYFANQAEERNIHLGVDFWAPVETSVHAVLDGTIHSFQNNTNHGDYGPTIIVEHTVEGGIFYSLYGHLSVASLDKCKVGAAVRAGECIAWLGDASVNGDYAPHLHFQLILDLEGNSGDYPGVCSDAKRDWYQSNCPDPLILLGLNP